jgi:tetratricopeptide (TPR) repeat protein
MAAREAIGTSRASAAFQRALMETGNVDSLSRCLTADVLSEAYGSLFPTWAYLMQHADAFKAAIPLLERVRDQLSTRGDWALANTLQALGDLYTRTARLQQAESSYSQALSLFKQVEDRLGEANTLKALGDLYTRTDRLQQAESSYSQALSLFKQVEDRLGEANTLNGLGMLGTAQGDGAKPYSLHLSALSILRDIQAQLEQGGTFGYLARAALVAGRPELGLYWAGQAAKLLATIDDRFGQMLALTDMAQAAAQLEKPEVLIMAFVLAWDHAVAIGDPSAPARAEPLAQILPNFDPNSALPEEERARYRSIIDDALRAHAESLAAQGIDPESPLE